MQNKGRFASSLRNRPVIRQEADRYGQGGTLPATDASRRSVIPTETWEFAQHEAKSLKSQGVASGLIDTLCRLAKISNHAAKKLNGPGRTWAYRVKCEILSTLIVAGMVRLTGKWPNGILALDIISDSPLRLHVPLNELRPEAQTLIASLSAAVPCTAPLHEHLTNKSHATVNKGCTNV